MSKQKSVFCIAVNREGRRKRNLTCLKSFSSCWPAPTRKRNKRRPRTSQHWKRVAVMEKQRLSVSGVRGLEVSVYNCEGCTINGVDLSHLLNLQAKWQAAKATGVAQVEAEGKTQEPTTTTSSEGSERLSKRRTSEILDQTELVLDQVNTLDDVATNLSEAVQATISSSGRTGLEDLYDSAAALKRLLVEADQRVATLSTCLHKLFTPGLVEATAGADNNNAKERERAVQLHEQLTNLRLNIGNNNAGAAPLTLPHERTRARARSLGRSSRSGSASSTHLSSHLDDEREGFREGFREGHSSPTSAAAAAIHRSRSQTNPLESIFPKEIVEALSCDVGDDVAEHHPSVTVLMSDIVGFTAWCSEVSPTKVIECLSAYFQVIDDLAETFGVYKVETVGDGYQAICGAPVYTEDHAEVMSLFALKVIETLPTMRKIFNHEDFDVRVGINSGPIVTGVIRADRIRWQLFGDTVNVASRMESTSIPGRIQISKSTRDLLLFRDMFTVEKRGLIDMKGKGQQETFFLIGAKQKDLFRSKSKRKSSSYLSEFIDKKEDTKSAEKVVEGSEGAGGEGGQDGTEDPATRSETSVDDDEDDKDGSDINVLLVDDLLSILLQYTRLLQREGINVVTARNGLEGLEQLKKNKFTCCFCDIHMPKMDGIEMVKAYRQWEEQNKKDKIPLFALTGNTDLGKNTASYKAAGFDEVISKTNYKEVLLSYVESCIV